MHNRRTFLWTEGFLPRNPFLSLGALCIRGRPRHQLILLARHVFSTDANPNSHALPLWLPVPGHFRGAHGALASFGSESDRSFCNSNSNSSSSPDVGTIRSHRHAGSGSCIQAHTYLLRSPLEEKRSQPNVGFPRRLREKGSSETDVPPAIRGSLEILTCSKRPLIRGLHVPGSLGVWGGERAAIGC